MSKIVRIPEAILSAKTRPVNFKGIKLDRIVKDMKNTLNQATNPKGVGLAAPQIGLPWQIFIIKPTDDSDCQVFINPQIIKHSECQTAHKNDQYKLEGCLSIPNIWGQVNRFSEIELTYLDEKGKQKTGVFTDFEAIIIQHEMDHLNGILFPQRALEQKHKLYQSIRKRNKEELTEIDI